MDGKKSDSYGRMRAIDLVLNKVFVKRFYSENAGFFLVLLGICFGFLKAPQHFEINQALAESPIYYLIPIALWLLYAVKVVRFCYRVGREDDSIMLGSITLVGKSRLFWLVAKAQLNLFLPVVGYGLFMAYVAFENQMAGSALIVMGVLVLFVLGLSLWQMNELLKPKDFGLAATGMVLKWNPKFYFEFYIHNLLSFQGLRLMLMKLLSLLILYISIQVFLEEGIDLRYLALGALLSATANSFFSMNYAQFERSELQIFRNLPIGLTKSAVSFGLTFMVLSLPELLIIAGQLSSTVKWFELIKLIVFIPSLLMLFMAMAYQPNFNQERFTKQVFFISATLFFVILGHAGVLSLTLLALIVSVLILKVWMSKAEVI